MNVLHARCRHCAVLYKHCGLIGGFCFVAWSGKGPAALMLAPTRELAAQIAAVLEEAGAKVGIRTLCVYGGVPKGPQSAALRRGVEIVVATPGRLEDLLEEGACRCGHVHAPCQTMPPCLPMLAGSLGDGVALRFLWQLKSSQ